jgi:riboflavin kinase/FMN adenylyltransferase
MQVINGLKHIEVPLQGSVLTLGNFDGVHRGHFKLLKEMIRAGKNLRLPTVAVTFAPHPSVILRPDNPTPLLFEAAETYREIERAGVNMLIVEPFTKEFSQISAEVFVTEFICRKLNPKHIFIGYDFAFGRERKGSIDVLKRLGCEIGFSVTQVEVELLDGEIVSSSRIRESVTAGQIEKANAFLGRNYFLNGRVVTGEGRGRTIGFATANIDSPASLRPSKGVYVTELICKNKRWPSVTNIGVKPTFRNDLKLTIETHILGQEINLYEQDVQLVFLKRIRDELKFSSSHELIDQIRKDVQFARNYFGL